MKHLFFFAEFGGGNNVLSSDLSMHDFESSVTFDGAVVVMARRALRGVMSLSRELLVTLSMWSVCDFRATVTCDF